MTWHLIFFFTLHRNLMMNWKYSCKGKNQIFTHDSDLAGRMQGILLIKRRDLLGAMDLVEGGEEFGLILNLNHQVDFSYVVR